MNKAEMVNSIYETGGFETKAAAERALGTVITVIQNGLKNDGAVSLTGFGVFEVKSRKARTGRNPRTGEKLKIRASKAVKFRPGKFLKESVN